MSHPSPSGPPPDDAARFRANLVRVLAVQVITLVLLWLLQRLFTV